MNVLQEQVPLPITERTFPVIHHCNMPWEEHQTWMADSTRQNTNLCRWLKLAELVDETYGNNIQERDERIVQGFCSSSLHRNKERQRERRVHRNSSFGSWETQLRLASGERFLQGRRLQRDLYVLPVPELTAALNVAFADHEAEQCCARTG